jgi:hypothetical protein
MPSSGHDLFAALLVGGHVVLAEHQVDHVARDQADGDEHDDAGQHQRGQQRQQSTGEIGAHQRRPGSVIGLSPAARGACGLPACRAFDLAVWLFEDL